MGITLLFLDHGMSQSMAIVCYEDQGLDPRIDFL